MILLGNCQMTVYCHILTQLFPCDTVETFALHEYILRDEPLPLDIMGHCDIFIYQPYRTQAQNYSLSHILSLLPDRCQTISIP